MPPLLEFYFHGSAAIGLAFKRDFSFVILYGVLYNGQAKTRTACFFRVTFINTIESLKDTALMLGCNTYAVILYAKNCMTIFRIDLN